MQMRVRTFAATGVITTALAVSVPAGAVPISHFVYTEAARTIVYDLPQQPTPTFIFQNQFDVFHQTIFINGVTYLDVGLDFFLLAGGGGIETDGLPAGIGYNEIGPQVFTGPLTAPTFVDGLYQLSPPPAGNPVNATLTITTTDVPANIPEPGSLALLGSGLLATCLTWLRRARG